MDKPEDIPQDVWDYAEIALKFVPAGDDKAQIASVARAILKAKEDEREECARIARELAEEFWQFEITPYDTEHAMGKSSGAEAVADALSRSKPTRC